MDNRKMSGMCVAIIVFVCAAFAQQPATHPNAEQAASPNTANDASQKVVLKVGSTQVSEAEMNAIISRLDPKAQSVIAVKGRQPVADEYIRLTLLSQRAVEQHLDQSPEVRLELELQRKQILAQTEYQKIATEHPVSQEEINEYYAAHRPDFDTVRVREFLVRKQPAGKDNGDPLQGLPPERAKITAQSIRKALLAGKDVDEVAQTYPSSSGVMLVDHTPRLLHRADVKPALEKETFNLTNGGVSQIIDTPQAFIVVKVLERNQPELKDVASEIRVKLQRQRLDAEIEDMKKSYGIWMDEDYFKGPPEAAVAGQPASSKLLTEP